MLRAHIFFDTCSNNTSPDPTRPAQDDAAQWLVTSPGASAISTRAKGWRDRVTEEADAEQLTIQVFSDYLIDNFASHEGAQILREKPLVRRRAVFCIVLALVVGSCESHRCVGPLTILPLPPPALQGQCIKNFKTYIKQSLQPSSRRPNNPNHALRKVLLTDELCSGRRGSVVAPPGGVTVAVFIESKLDDLFAALKKSVTECIGAERTERGDVHAYRHLAVLPSNSVFTLPASRLSTEIAFANLELSIEAALSPARSNDREVRKSAAGRFYVGAVEAVLAAVLEVDAGERIELLKAVLEEGTEARPASSHSPILQPSALGACARAAYCSGSLTSSVPLCQVRELIGNRVRALEALAANKQALTR